jgi:hypothetical protein
VEDLRRRVAGRRRRRHSLHAALAGVALVMAAAAVLPLLDRPSDAPTRVVAAATGLPEVGRAPAGGSTVVLAGDRHCAYLGWSDARPGDPPLAGGCGGPEPGHSVQTFRSPVDIGDNLTAAILHAGPSMTRFVAHLDDGRTVEGSIGAHGWAVVVADGRIVGVSGIDVRGLPVPEWIVG